VFNRTEHFNLGSHFGVQGHDNEAQALEEFAPSLSRGRVYHGLNWSNGRWITRQILFTQHISRIGDYAVIRSITARDYSVVARVVFCSFTSSPCVRWIYEHSSRVEMKKWAEAPR
jgi:hypothetical protein